MLYLSSFKMFLLKVRELREQLRKREQLEGELEAMRNQVNIQKPSADKLFKLVFFVLVIPG